MKHEFRVNNFDLLRILAAAQVVLTHSVTHLGITKPWGWSVVDAFPGVPIFFAISGFLISASYERSSELRSYARNRLLRIVPGLWFVVLLTIPVAAMFGFNFLNVRAAAWLVLQLFGFVFTPGFLKDFGFGSYNGALWTIPIELQFYFVMPLLYLATKGALKRRTAIFAGVFAVFATIALVYAMKSSPLAENAIEPASHKLFRYSFLPHFYLFLAGVLMQRLHSHRSRWIAGKGVFWLAGYLGIYYGPGFGTAPLYILATLMLGVTVVSLAYTHPTVSHRLLRGNDISYGVYIYHGLILNVMVEKGWGGRLGYVPLVLFSTAVAATFSWHFIEQPFLRRKRASINTVTAPAG